MDTELFNSLIIGYECFLADCNPKNINDDDLLTQIIHYYIKHFMNTSFEREKLDIIFERIVGPLMHKNMLHELSKIICLYTDYSDKYNAINNKIQKLVQAYDFFDKVNSF